MQKKLIVLALAGLVSAPAFAETTTTVYGVVDAAIVNVAGTGLIGGTTAVSGGWAGSRFGIKATEDLDNGMKAIAVVEYGLDTETNGNTTAVAGANSTTLTGTTAGSTSTNTLMTNLTARQQMVALAGGFGTVATGYLQTTAYDFGIKYNVVGGSMISPLGNIVKGQGFLIGDQGAANRAQRAIAYISPRVAGVSVAVNYSAALANVNGNYGDVNQPTTPTAVALSATSASLVSVDYTEGPLAVAFVYAGTNADVFTGNRTEYALGGSYDLGVATIKATYQTSSTANAVTTTNANATASDTAMSIGATVPVAGGTLALSYAGSTINSIASTASGQNANGYTVAFLQPMSKTTTAYVGYSAMNQGNTSKVTIGNNLLTTVNGAGNTSGTSSVLAFGLNKKF